jgi:hypothetical protein
MVLAGALALVGGFFWYASIVPVGEIVLDRNADGIVALTGGPDRIEDAVELLASRRAKRLFITGVNPQTRDAELRRLSP